jgi:5-methylcytosine-specific restriction enzyme subunit McrC
LKFVANNIPLNNFIPVEVNATFESGEKFIHFLQAMLWLNMLTKAARHTLPTVRLQKEHISPVSRGRIDVRRTIKSRLKDQSNIVSISSYKDTNNPVTTSVVLAFFKIQRWFPKHNLLNWLPEVIALRLQQMIDATPRHSAAPKAREIKKARLRSIAKFYTPLTRLSLDILKNKGISEKRSDDESSTFLLDVAELWEIYILDVLQEASPSQVDVLHGTMEGNEYLLTDQSGSHHYGKLLPDYIFTDNGQTISIGDAKYKRLGDKPWMSPKRDDLYQITAYLSRYSKCNASFYYPAWGEEEDKTCIFSDKNPWRLESGQLINFISVPTEKSAAIDHLRNFHYPSGS